MCKYRYNKVFHGKYIMLLNYVYSILLTKLYENSSYTMRRIWTQEIFLISRKYIGSVSLTNLPALQKEGKMSRLVAQSVMSATVTLGNWDYG